MTNPPSEEQPKVILESVTDSFTILHVNYLLTDLSGLQVSRNEHPEGEEWSPLVMEILEIPGVETVVLRPYGVGIHRAAAFDFDRILPEVERLLYWVGNALDPYSSDLHVRGGDGAISPSLGASELDTEKTTP
jgi:hypothetical protein